MAQMLISGELAAAIGVEVKDPNVAPLIPNALEAGLNAMRERGQYPINHLVVVKDDLLAAHPDLAADIFNTFAQAKRLYVEKLKSGALERPDAADRTHQRVLELTDDPMPYGIEPNRKVIEELIANARLQGQSRLAP